MTGTTFDRDALAQWYATRHTKTDPGIRTIYYLPTKSPDREIRFLEINESMAQRDSDPIEPFDFGVDTGDENAHTLVVIDVTPVQWEKIRNHEIDLPESWSLDGAIELPRGH
jgi:hypothetical protein